jgi:hypothetical protein
MEPWFHKRTPSRSDSPYTVTTCFSKIEVLLTKEYFPGDILPSECPTKFVKAHAYLSNASRMLNLCVQ